MFYCLQESLTARALVIPEASGSCVRANVVQLYDVI